LADVFISHAHSTAQQARAAADALRAAGYSVWLDDDLPAHRAFGKEIQAQLIAAKAALVIWSADAVESDWVLSEANRARQDRKLVQVTLDGVDLPMPFDQIQCADMVGWSGETDSHGWKKVLDSVTQLVRGKGEPAPSTSAEIEPAALGLADKPSIALLAFANLSGDPDQEYFAEGMVVEIATALARFPSLFVVSGSSSLTYRDSDASRGRIARELGVRYLLEGSVRKAGDRVRIAVQLIEASDDVQLWADRFDGTLEDVFALQDQVANAVASQIEPSIQIAEIRRAHARPTEDLTAYDLYLRALSIGQRYDKEAVREGLALLDQAIARDPAYGLALATAADFCALRTVTGWSDDAAEDRRLALAYRAAALRAAPDDPAVLAHTAIAASFIGMDSGVALAAAERAVALSPGAAFAWFASGLVHVYAGDAARALADLETSTRLDPRSPWRPIVLDNIVIALFSLRRFNEAIEKSREVCDLLPGLAPLYEPYIASALAHMGRMDEAREIAGRVSDELLAAWSGWLAVINPADRELVEAGFALARA
jgi:adenylate cyclase